MENYQKNFDTKQLSSKYFHRDISKNPKKYFPIPDGVDVIIKKNTKDIFYLVMPINKLDPDIIGQINASGASTLSSVGSASSVGTLSSVVSTVGTAFSAGSAGSLGTVNVDTEGR